jgi:hypothetical protein
LVVTPRGRHEHIFLPLTLSCQQAPQMRQKKEAEDPRERERERERERVAAP